MSLSRRFLQETQKRDIEQMTSVEGLREIALFLLDKMHTLEDMTRKLMQETMIQNIATARKDRRIETFITKTCQENESSSS